MAPSFLEDLNPNSLLALLLADRTAPIGSGALVSDETSDRKDGKKKTAHVGKQYLSGIGKIDGGWSL